MTDPNKPSDVDKARADQQQSQIATEGDKSNAPTKAEVKTQDKPKPRAKTKSDERKPVATDTGRKVPEGRKVQGAMLTIDERHAEEHGKPFNKPGKTVGRQIELHDRVTLHTPNAIDHKNETPAYVIGFNDVTGNPNLRIEALTPALATKPMEFGNIPQNDPLEPNGAYWYWPDGAGTAKQ